MDEYLDEPRMTDDELQAEFAALFPHGWAGADVLAEIAPDGWANSPLATVFHPSAQQVYEESVRMHRNMAKMFRKKSDDSPPRPEPTLEEIEADYDDAPIEPERECQELVGQCLWDIFSDNHEVLAADGRQLDLGSHRAAGGFLAEVLNGQGGPAPQARPPELDAMMEKLFPPPPPGDSQTAQFMAQMRKEMFGEGGYTYLDFYMGTRMIADRADLKPVYEMIFRRLRARQMDWVYHFPRLFLADMRPLKKMLDEQERGDEPEFAGYDPSAAFEEEAADHARDEEIAELREKLDDGHREAVEAARDAEPPDIVLAYQAVYGQLPRGWPPEV